MKKTSYIIFGGTILLAGCGDDEGTSTVSTDAESMSAYEVEHHLGVAEFEETPENVVTLFQGANDTAVALGYEPVGIVESWLEQPVYEYLRDDLSESTIVGDEIQPNLEEIAALEPDVIIATQSRHEEVYEQLSDIAPTVVLEELNDFKATLEIMGETLGEEDQAKQLLDHWDERIEDFQSQMESTQDEWPMTRSVINFRSDSLRLFVEGFPGSVLSDAGFEMPDNQQQAYETDETFIELTNTESIPELESDMFFVYMQSNQEADELDEAWQLWTDHPLWGELEAVDQDQVEMVDEVIWSMGAGFIAANEMLDDLYEIFELEDGE
ncbi:ABC transporter substrate-binding protein [Geomicrobium sp. JSM 1781026]|uniref:ABC transporter substrate-binding protein n=1 Tax=Geomicrobium sp. JSM 1781026 TaxID=3344580 RepID=UPI0035C129D7